MSGKRIEKKGKLLRHTGFDSHTRFQGHRGSSQVLPARPDAFTRSPSISLGRVSGVLRL